MHKIILKKYITDQVQETVDNSTSSSTKPLVLGQSSIDLSTSVAVIPSETSAFTVVKRRCSTHYPTDSFCNSFINGAASCARPKEDTVESEYIETTSTKRFKATISKCSTESKEQFEDAEMNKNKKTVNDADVMRFMCQWCGFECRWLYQIKQHMRIDHAREKPFRCSECSYGSNWKGDIKTHKNKYHANNSKAKVIQVPDRLLFQDMKFIKYFKLNHNISNTNQIDRESNDENSKDFNRKNMVTMKEITCLLDQNNENKLEVNLHESKKDFICPCCPFATNILNELERHLSLHLNSKPYQCSSCDFKCKWKKNFKAHLLLHNQDGPSPAQKATKTNKIKRKIDDHL